MKFSVNKIFGKPKRQLIVWDTRGMMNRKTKSYKRL